ncbi:acyl-CoA N-acyltransferase [Fimicolochytrium jonesii]|uniref:acyl-CoA N-acyltransferase n=1 Tax=Fimicolochytrium jonesii TaxID=1396493 RepID=UPI0022FDECFF|nr:acyl-CoA N-acyltransferase [Fimicolochytrium jonesii]KAI8815777.1 acyl-CoA N-acyltransferase [Fimicolochytrium jonesii]
MPTTSPNDEPIHSPTKSVGLTVCSHTGVSVRPALPSGAASIANVHIRSWQWAYAGLMPASYLDNLAPSLERRTQRWLDRLSAPASNNPTVTLVPELDNEVVAFASLDPPRDKIFTTAEMELTSLYLHLHAAGQGIGRALMDVIKNEIRHLGMHHATLWVLDTNERARRFYEREGWRVTKDVKVETVGTMDLREANTKGTENLSTEEARCEAGAAPASRRISS